MILYYQFPMATFKKEAYDKIFEGWGGYIPNAPKEYNEILDSLNSFCGVNGNYVTEIRGEADNGKRGKLIGYVGIYFSKEERIVYSTIEIRAKLTAQKRMETLDILLKSLEDYSKNAFQVLKEFDLIA